MRPRDFTRFIGWAAVAGFFAAALLSPGALVSIRLWVVAAAVIVVGSAFVRLIIVARVEVIESTPAWWPIRRRPQRERGPVHDFRALEGIVRDASHDPRVHTYRLQPRLIELARHYLPIEHGLDLDRNPVETATLLGDLAWLIDPEITGRAPTPNELDRFLDLVIDNTTSEGAPTP